MGLKVLMIGAYPLEPGTRERRYRVGDKHKLPFRHWPKTLTTLDSVTVLRFHEGEASTGFRV